MAATLKVVPKSKQEPEADKQHQTKVMNILTTYMRGKQNEVVKTTRAVHANNAVLNCVNHMQLNHYEADVAEVYDTVTAEVHAVVVFKPGAGKIEIVYQREVKENA